jgi:hypothetical protein
MDVVRERVFDVELHPPDVIAGEPPNKYGGKLWSTEQIGYRHVGQVSG